jgi:hypothetical protein
VVLAYDLDVPIGQRQNLEAEGVDADKGGTVLHIQVRQDFGAVLFTADLALGPHGPQGDITVWAPRKGEMDTRTPDSVPIRAIAIRPQAPLCRAKP